MFVRWRIKIRSRPAQIFAVDTFEQFGYCHVFSDVLFLYFALICSAWIFAFKIIAVVITVLGLGLWLALGLPVGLLQGP